MSRVSDYGYANAKLRARIGSIRDSRIIDDMIKAPNLVEAIGSLKNSRHSHLVDVYSQTGDLQQVELALFAEEITAYREVAGMVPSGISVFVKTLLEKLEIENLKNALRMWYSEVIRHHSIRFRAGYLYDDEIVWPLNWSGIINAPDYSGVLSAVKDTPYFSVLSSYSQSDIASKGMFGLEISLDHLYFDSLFRAISSLSEKDREIASSVYLVDMDLKNILLFIRYGYYHDVGREELGHIVIPHGMVYQESIRHHLLDSSDPVAVLRSIIGGKYSDVAEEIDRVRRMSDDITTRKENADSILHIERFLGEFRKREYSKILSGDPLSIGVILAYFFLAGNEDSMIRAVLSAKLYKWSEDKIREEVV